MTLDDPIVESTESQPDSSHDTPEQSADQGDHELLADPLRQTVVDLRVRRDRSFRAVGRIDVYGVAAAFVIYPTPLVLRVTD